MAKPPKNAVLIRRAYTTSRFGQLHYTEGTPNQTVSVPQTPLILLHQNPSSSREYEPLIIEMAQDRRVIAFDTPGSGMSDGPNGPLVVADYAAAFADGIDNLGLESVDVYGYHTGVFLAAELALRRRDIIRRVIMTGVPFRSPAEMAQRFASAVNTPPLTEDGKDVLDQLAALWRYVVTKRDPQVSLDRAAQMFMEKAKPMNRYWWPYFGVWSYLVTDRFPKITQVVLVLQPHEDLLEQSRQAATLIPNGSFIEMPTLDRDIFDVDSLSLATEIRRFLD